MDLTHRALLHQSTKHFQIDTTARDDRQAGAGTRHQLMQVSAPVLYRTVPAAGQNAIDVLVP
jgi:hypothetical protein